MPVLYRSAKCGHNSLSIRTTCVLSMMQISSTISWLWFKSKWHIKHGIISIGLIWLNYIYCEKFGHVISVCTLIRSYGITQIITQSIFPILGLRSYMFEIYFMAVQYSLTSIVSPLISGTCQFVVKRLLKAQFRLQLTWKPVETYAGRRMWQFTGKESSK